MAQTKIQERQIEFDEHIANTVLAGPAAGVPAIPTFRALVGADMPAAIPAGLANPSALVGLTAVNGIATTAMRSDGAPALDQSINPTWTGNKHLYQPSVDAVDVLKVVNSAGTSTVLQVDTTNKRVGIRKAPDVTPWNGGTTHVGLDVGGGAQFGASGIAANISTLFWRQSEYSGGFNVYKRGSAANIDASILNDCEIGYNSFYGWDGSVYGRSNFFLAQATENWSLTAHGSRLKFSTIANTTTTESIRMVIDQSGFVGFGVPIPAAKVHISGAPFATGTIGDGTNAPQLHVAGAYSATGQIVSINNYNGTRILTLQGVGNLGVCVQTPVALIHGIKTTEQLRLGYDASNYASFTVGAAGALTLATVDAGAAAGHIILNPDGMVGILMTPTYTLDVTGNFRCSTGFGCNAALPQTAYASGGALAAYATGAFGLNSDANMSALHAMVVAIRAALVANGIMS